MLPKFTDQHLFSLFLMDYLASKLREKRYTIEVHNQIIMKFRIIMKPYTKFTF